MAKIEDDIRTAKEEEEQKKQEMESVRNRMKQDGGAADASAQPEADANQAAPDSGDANAAEDDTTREEQNEDDLLHHHTEKKINIRLLERYSGFCHPMPLYVFFKVCTDVFETAPFSDLTLCLLSLKGSKGGGGTSWRQSPQTH